jgi:plasmid stability protein
MEPKCNQNGTTDTSPLVNPMASMTIKNIPEPLYRALKQSAESHHRSINGEVIFLLEQSLLARRVSREQLLEEMRQMREEIGPGAALSPEEIRAAINEGRE